EAMGLGDVHLLACIGAVLGWFDPILVFFLAPFSGLLWAFVSMGIASVFKRARRELPYGPHLAVATFLVIACRPGIEWLWVTLLPGVPWVERGLCP
ncbi:MAG: prepilin peptidase, partial [Phycisphaerales bacterium]|nr:prepilin peptidase [Phycisphaerales bacterium]